MKSLILAIEKIASENPEGFTIEVPSLEFVQSGIVSAYEATQNNFDSSNLVQVLNHAISHSSILGGWLDSETNIFYFDSCKIFKDLEEAIKFGKENNQIAIFDLDTLTEIRL